MASTYASHAGIAVPYDDVLDGDTPPEPDWAIAAGAGRDLADLAALATEDLDPVSLRAIAGLTALETCDPSLLAAAGHARAVLDGIIAAQRLVGHIQALQQQWVAAFARPGVAVPIEQVADAAGNVATDICQLEVPEASDGTIDTPALLGHPVWGPAVTDTAARFASAEVGCALNLAPVTARTRVEKALEMVDGLPATLAAQRAGRLDGYRASIIADRTAVLTARQRRAVEQRLLPEAGGLTGAALRRRVDTEAIACDPEAAAANVRRAKQRREVYVTAADDDMAVFRATVSAPDAMAADGVLDAIATSLRTVGLADGRGTNQLRADAFSDLFRTLAETGHAHIHAGTTGSAPGADGIAPDCATGRGNTTGRDGAAGQGGATGGGTEQEAGGDRGSTPPSGIGPCTDRGNFGIEPPGHADSRATARACRRPVALNVYLTADSLAGLIDTPGELGGYGTITADTARALAESAETVRALICSPARAGSRSGPPSAKDPPGRGIHSDNLARSRSCGTVIDPGRAVYRPPDATADYVTTRDRHCQFPGCRASAARCDIDHRIPYQQTGATCPCNLDLLCRAHHRLKTFTDWQAVPRADGLLTWTSPLGHTHQTTPAHEAHPATLTRPAAGKPADREPPDPIPPPF